MLVANYDADKKLELISNLGIINPNYGLKKHYSFVYFCCKLATFT